MDRYIDSVMVGSDRVDERARLITRLCDTVAPLVGDLGPDTPELIRSALLGAMRAAHVRPVDVVADVLGGLADATGAPLPTLDDVPPGGTLALGVCDGRGVSDHALAAATGIDRDAVATCRDAARLVVGLPPAPQACTRRHAERPDDRVCAVCVLVRADAATARALVEDRGLVPRGRVIDRVVERATRWQADMLRPRVHAVVDGPSPWTAIAGLAV